MAKNESKRLKPKLQAADLKCCNCVLGLTGYAPAQSKYSKAGINDTIKEVEAARTAETRINAAAKRARQRAVRAEWDLHNLTLGVKLQVMAQFGEDSDEVMVTGLKKKSQYKRPARRKEISPLDKVA